MPPVKVGVFHTMKDIYISHYRHIEEEIDHIEIIWYISHPPLTSDTTTVNLRVKSRLTNENDIMLNFLSVRLRFTDFDYPFGIFKLFLKPNILSLTYEKLFYFRYIYEFGINENEVCMILLYFIYR
jgi:hypothetical protein